MTAKGGVTGQRRNKRSLILLVLIVSGDFTAGAGGAFAVGMKILKFSNKCQ